MEPQIRFCTSADGTRIAYATLGDGPPLVLVAGWGICLEFDWQLPDGRAFHERLAEGRLLVRVDRRGSGASQREVDDMSLEAQVGDLAAVVDHVKLERFDLCGALDGTAVAVAYSAQYPERVSRLVLWEPFPSGKEIAPLGAVESFAELVRKSWGLARRAMADLAFPSGPTELQRMVASYVRESVTPDVAAKYLEFRNGVDVRTHLSQVKAPTLVLHRRGDRNVPVSAGRAAAALIPDARFVALEGDIAAYYSGDMSYVETLTQFLDEGRGRAPAAEAPEVGAFRTVLFTDVEASTSLTQRLGDAKAREVFRTHERIMREALRAHGGSEVKTMGDGFMASFSSATKALGCAVAMQRAFAEHNETAHEPIKVRVGLNAGEPIAEEEDLFGTAVILAARIAAQAEGGEILASEAVRQIVAGKGFLFADRGETALRGFEDLVRLYEVRWEP